MSMLDRYRRTGGFVQLLKLLETCGVSKQDKFLEIIRAEDTLWADAIERKMLHFDRIFGWSDEAVAEICGTLQDLTIAIILHGAPTATSTKIRATFSHARRRKVEDLYTTNNPTASEIQTMELKVVETVRQMAVDGYLRLDKVDPELMIEDGVEDRLAHGAPLPHERRKGTAATVAKLPSAPAAAAAQASAPTNDHRSEPTEAGTVLDFSMATGLGSHERAATAGADHGTLAEITQLRKKVLDLNKENTALKHDVTVLKSKIEQIRKIV